ncbi:uncharacterized protein CELE_R02F2.6 [Caenorhabditis elegans]|uniref:Uncharacterized protein n=1 Tax=Caenorhabditis elegans TaxID=6239 RepID=Q21647_CAEEL|nr:Uncharacterized protein CELE_R02F2.6 [Caenorhabditis elegans]CCD68400.1 Uncharacterized protein CELE_R02F2.6 [Caenorhabditis elegans]|eukprot:NP_498168.1 Uncharacterized protein CELE_R02F2.6 [Caenorhabditis elegans]
MAVEPHTQEAVVAGTGDLETVVDVEVVEASVHWEVELVAAAAVEVEVEVDSYSEVDSGQDRGLIGFRFDSENIVFETRNL